MSAPPFTFTEERNTVYYHNIRVYIAGADVTYALTSDKSKLVYTLNFGENTDGLYVVPVQ